MKAFLVLPISANGHLFAGIIKTSSGDFKFTLINKGYSGTSGQFLHCTFDKENKRSLENLIEQVTYTKGDTLESHHRRQQFIVDKVYDKFEQSASSFKSYNITS